MKKVLFIVTLSAISSTAIAQQQQQQPKFIPYTINLEDHTKIMNYLNEQPAKFSIPLMQALGELAQKAIAEEENKIKDKK